MLCEHPSVSENPAVISNMTSTMLSTIALAALLLIASASLLMWHRRPSAPLEKVMPTLADAVSVTRRVAALNGADIPSAVSVRSIARQAAPYHTRPILQSAKPISLAPSAAAPMVLVARRPGLPRYSMRSERRVVVLR
jgi:hypothetical protein